MFYTIELLVKGDANVVKYYKTAKNWWSTIIPDCKDFDVEKMSKLLTATQLEFEGKCGGRFIGQEIMVIVGITQFYTTQDGFEGKCSPCDSLDNREKALRVYKAFMRSYCSLEIKQMAEEIARSYGLLEETL